MFLLVVRCACVYECCGGCDDDGGGGGAYGGDYLAQGRSAS